MPPSISKLKPTPKPITTAISQLPPEPIIDELPSAWDLTDLLRIVIYGESGTGKTTLWSSFPKPILCLVCSGGDRPEELKSIDTPEMRKVVDAKVLRSTADAGRVLQAASTRYKTVVLDHISGLQSLLLKEIQGWDDLPGIVTWGMVTQQVYGEIASRSIEILRKMLSFEMNCVIVAQERKDTPREEDQVKRAFIGPAVTPATNNWMLPAVSYLVQTYKAPRMETYDYEGVQMERRLPGVYYRIRTGEDDIIATKFRVPRSMPKPDYIEVNRTESGYQKMMDVIKGRAK